jgi:acetylornithine/succinyldiaminopimelate/putrescine aminotransferase
VGEYLRESLLSLRSDGVPVATVRGRGLMVAFDLADGGAPGFARQALLEHRLVVNATGPQTIRLEPPLTISEAEIADAVGRVRALL